MSDLDPYWAYVDYSLFIYREKTLFKKIRKPYNLSPYLLGLAYKAPTRRLQVTCSAPTTLLFNLFRNYYCYNKPINALVSQTILNITLI